MPFTSTRRTALAACALAALALTGQPAAAQDYPNRPVKLIVPAAPGAAPDVIARLLAERLGALWGKTLIVENKPGAGGIPGMSALARSTADGYTLGFVPAAMGTITPLVYKNPQFNRSYKPIQTYPCLSKAAQNGTSSKTGTPAEQCC